MDKKEKLEQFTPFTHEEFYQRYYVHRIAASSIILNTNKKILLVKEIRKGRYYWGLPGGLLEKQESMITGLIREVKEETNCEVKPYGLLSITNWAGKSIFESDTRIQSGFHFIMVSDYLSGIPKPDGLEALETGFFSVDEFENFSISKSIQDYLTAVEEKKFLPLKASDFTNGDMYRYIFSL